MCNLKKSRGQGREKQAHLPSHQRIRKGLVRQDEKPSDSKCPTPGHQRPQCHPHRQRSSGKPGHPPTHEASHDHPDPVPSVRTCAGLRLLPAVTESTVHPGVSGSRVGNWTPATGQFQGSALCPHNHVSSRPRLKAQIRCKVPKYGEKMSSFNQKNCTSYPQSRKNRIKTIHASIKVTEMLQSSGRFQSGHDKILQQAITHLKRMIKYKVTTKKRLSAKK